MLLCQRQHALVIFEDRGHLVARQPADVQPPRAVEKGGVDNARGAAIPHGAAIVEHRQRDLPGIAVEHRRQPRRRRAGLSGDTDTAAEEPAEKIPDYPAARAAQIAGGRGGGEAEKLAQGEIHQIGGLDLACPGEADKGVLHAPERGLDRVLGDIGHGELRAEDIVQPALDARLPVIAVLQILRVGLPEPVAGDLVDHPGIALVAKSRRAQLLDRGDAPRLDLALLEVHRAAKALPELLDDIPDEIDLFLRATPATAIRGQAVDQRGEAFLLAQPTLQKRLLFIESIERRPCLRLVGLGRPPLHPATIRRQDRLDLGAAAGHDPGDTRLRLACPGLKRRDFRVKADILEFKRQEPALQGRQRLARALQFPGHRGGTRGGPGIVDLARGVGGLLGERERAIERLLQLLDLGAVETHLREHVAEGRRPVLSQEIARAGQFQHLVCQRANCPHARLLGIRIHDGGDFPLQTADLFRHADDLGLGIAEIDVFQPLEGQHRLLCDAAGLLADTGHPCEFFGKPGNDRDIAILKAIEHVNDRAEYPAQEIGVEGPFLEHPGAACLIADFAAHAPHLFDDALAQRGDVADIEKAHAKNIPEA